MSSGIAASEGPTTFPVPALPRVPRNCRRDPPGGAQRRICLARLPWKKRRSSGPAKHGTSLIFEDAPLDYDQGTKGTASRAGCVSPQRSDGGRTVFLVLDSASRTHDTGPSLDRGLLAAELSSKELGR